MKVTTLIASIGTTLLAGILSLTPSALAFADDPVIECGDFSHTSKVVSGEVTHMCPGLNADNYQYHVIEALLALEAALLDILDMDGERMPDCNIEDCPRPEYVGCEPEVDIRNGLADTKYSRGRLLLPDGTQSWYIRMELKANKSVNLRCSSCLAPIGDEPLD